VIGAAAKLAVGCELEPDALLQGEHILDCGVLRLRQRLAVDLAAAEFRPQIEQALRTKKTADVLGAERRLVRGQCLLLATSSLGTNPFLARYSR
jgi:hypothetical protein